MLNLTNMVKAPVRNWEVTMHLRTSMNAAQNARKRIENVQAIDEKEAKTIANKRRPEFKAMSARTV